MSRHNHGSVAMILLAFVLTFAAAPGVFANDDVYREGTQSQKMFHKLGRGITNILTGWIEIPKNIAKEWRAIDPFSGFVVGTCEGVAWGLGRTAAGCYDTLTFFLPIPADYAPLMEPEFILPGIWGEPAPFMDPVTNLKPLR